MNVSKTFGPSLTPKEYDHFFCFCEEDGEKPNAMIAILIRQYIEKKQIDHYTEKRPVEAI